MFLHLVCVGGGDHHLHRVALASATGLGISTCGPRMGDVLLQIRPGWEDARAEELQQTAVASIRNS